MFAVNVAEGLFELGDISEPSLVAGGVDPGFEVEADLHQPWGLVGVDLLARAAEAGVLVDAWGGVGADAGAELDATLREVVGEVRELPAGGWAFS
jgi:hypothetical protein